MFTRIDTILPESIKKNGIAPSVARANALSAFEEKARELLSAEHAASFKPLHLTGTTLTVACRTSAVATRLRAMEAELLEAIGRSGSEKVERLRLMLAPWR